MVLENETQILPKTLIEFLNWEPNDGFKYEWNDGELIKFEGMNKKQVYIYNVLNKLHNHDFQLSKLLDSNYIF